MRSIAVSRRWTGQSSPGCPNPLVTEDRRAAEPPLPRRAARSQSRASMGMGRPAADSFKEVLRHAPSSTRRLPLAREPRARKGPRRLAQRVPHRGLPRQRLQGAVATRPARRLKAFVLSAKKMREDHADKRFCPRRALAAGWQQESVAKPTATTERRGCPYRKASPCATNDEGVFAFPGLSQSLPRELRRI